METTTKESNKNFSISKVDELSRRMKQIVDHFYGGNKRKYAEAIGAKTGAITYFMPEGTGRKGYPGYEVIAKTLSVHPEVSAEWLIRGVGRMLDRKTEVLDETKKNNYDDQIRNMEKEVKYWKQRFDQCQDNLNKIIAKL